MAATKKITARTINAQLAALGICERLVQGRGYVYFVDGDAAGWYSSSIGVCYVADLVQPTLAATMANVLAHRAFLAGAR